MRCIFYPDMARISHLAAPDISDRSYTIQADIDVPANGADGVLLAWGCRFGGMSLYVQQGKPCFEYVYSETITHILQSPDVLGAGIHSITLRFDRTSKSAGQATLLVDNQCVDQATIPKTWATYGITAGITCGADDGGPPVTDRYMRPFRFSGTLHKVSVDLGSDGERSDQELLKTLIREE